MKIDTRRAKYMGVLNVVDWAKCVGVKNVHIGEVDAFSAATERSR